jgi:hypothetical protein
MTRLVRALWADREFRLFTLTCALAYVAACGVAIVGG